MSTSGILDMMSLVINTSSVNVNWLHFQFRGKLHSDLEMQYFYAILCQLSSCLLKYSNKSIKWMRLLLMATRPLDQE